jgi:hypothetical protein
VQRQTPNFIIVIAICQDIAVFHGINSAILADFLRKTFCHLIAPFLIITCFAIGFPAAVSIRTPPFHGGYSVFSRYNYIIGLFAFLSSVFSRFYVKKRYLQKSKNIWQVFFPITIAENRKRAKSARPRRS